MGEMMMSGFLGGWFDIEPGRRDEIEGIGRFLLSPFRFIDEVTKDMLEDIREAVRPRKERLAALEARYDRVAEMERKNEKEKSKLQTFILQNKDKVKERLLKMRDEFRERRDIYREIAGEVIMAIVDSDTLNDKYHEWKRAGEQREALSGKLLHTKEAKKIRDGKVIHLPADLEKEKGLSRTVDAQIEKTLSQPELSR
jgi:hypothetical protein